MRPVWNAAKFSVTLLISFHQPIAGRERDSSDTEKPGTGAGSVEEVTHTDDMDDVAHRVAMSGDVKILVSTRPASR